MPRDDINYKVALAAGAKQLEAGQLKKAEQQFRFAVKRCKECGGGYRGLAKVFVELEDRAAALELLREGAQTLSRAGNRKEAIDLLRDAVGLAPEDRVLHRRYAAALANAGQDEGAVAEYDRYVSLVLAGGDRERARIEIAYALETLGALPGLEAVERLITGGPAAVSATVAAAPVADGSATSAVDRFFAEVTRSTGTDRLQRALALDAGAQHLLSRGDTQAAAVALEAARALFGERLDHAAGDLLLQLVASGSVGREAQRLLIGVARMLGSEDIARQKSALLAHALRLDGQPDAAAEVERLAG
jgi:thioredoxin-like negative regulator of GroEL